ncbi:MAG: hypothetical protein IT285_05300 [Bdellovibrionales bacterium]|nr:hypothetical protein [Bdellovibrionales bacterium]
MRYQGWSGCTLESLEKGRLSPLVFDPAPDQKLGRGSKVILITHGHPEHVLGAVSHLKIAERDPVSIVGSKSVCRYLRRRSRVEADTFHAVLPGDSIMVAGWKVRVFGWDHMGLLPQDWRTKLSYLAKLAAHPLHLAGIALDGILGPWHKPMLGFRVEAPEIAAPVVYMGEGLHRKTTSSRIREAFGEKPVSALIAAVEPEDTLELPEILKAQAVGGVIAFEAHKIWRERFGMPQIDLPDLKQRLLERGLRSWTPGPGESVELT